MGMHGEHSDSYTVVVGCHSYRLCVTDEPIDCFFMHRKEKC